MSTEAALGWLLSLNAACTSSPLRPSSPEFTDWLQISPSSQSSPPPPQQLEQDLASSSSFSFLGPSSSSSDQQAIFSQHNRMLSLDSSTTTLLNTPSPAPPPPIAPLPFYSPTGYHIDYNSTANSPSLFQDSFATYYDPPSFDLPLASDVSPVIRADKVSEYLNMLNKEKSTKQKRKKRVKKPRKSQTQPTQPQASTSSSFVDKLSGPPSFDASPLVLYPPQAPFQLMSPLKLSPPSTGSSQSPLAEVDLNSPSRAASFVMDENRLPTPLPKIRAPVFLAAATPSPQNTTPSFSLENLSPMSPLTPLPPSSPPKPKLPKIILNLKKRSLAQENEAPDVLLVKTSTPIRQFKRPRKKLVIESSPFTENDDSDSYSDASSEVSIPLSKVLPHPSTFRRILPPPCPIPVAPPAPPAAVASGSGSGSTAPATSAPAKPSTSKAKSASTATSAPPALRRSGFTNRSLPANVEISSNYPLFYRRFPASSYYQPIGKDSPLTLFSHPHPSGTYNPPRNKFDLYTPRFVKGKGTEKLGLCPICIEPVERGGEDRKVWLAMKFSAFNYHLQYAHGVSASTGTPFSPPTAFRVVPRPGAGKKEKTQIEQGKCHKCSKWVNVEGVKDMGSKVPELHWWKHAAACHQTSRIVGEGEWFERDEVFDVLEGLVG